MAKPSFASLPLLALGLIVVPIAAYAASEPAAKSSTFSTKKICETIKPTGSRLGGTRRCRTAAEIEELKAEARRTVDHVQTMKVDACAPPQPC